MRRIRLIHWHAGEAEERAERLRATGYVVDAAVPDGPASLRALRDDPPDAVVIDLGRLPSHGREVGVSLRVAKSTRAIPLVFVNGEPAKVGRVRELLPDAVFTVADPPERATLRDAAGGDCDLVLWFVTTRDAVGATSWR